MLENAILEHAKAINNLADALRGVGQLPLTGLVNVLQTCEIPAVISSEASGAVVEKAVKPKKEEPTGPFYWKDAETNFFGKESTKKALDKMLGEKKSIVVIEEAEYKTLEAELRERNAKAAEKMATEKAVEPPTVEDVIAVFTKYLPKDLDAEERKVRHAFVKPLLQRFGVEKATMLRPEHRAEAIALVERKMAGADIDPTAANFDEGLV